MTTIDKTLAGASARRLNSLIDDMGEPRRFPLRNEIMAVLMSGGARASVALACRGDDLTAQTVLLRSGLRLGLIRSS